MVTARDVTRMAMALEGTQQAPHFDRTAFKVARIYATLAGDGRSLNLRLTPDEQAMKCTVAPNVFAPVPNAWGAQGWTTMTLAAATKADLEAALAAAWRGAHAKPKAKRRSRA